MNVMGLGFVYTIHSKMGFLAPCQENQGCSVKIVKTKTECFNNVQCLEPTRLVGIRALF